MLTLVEKLCRPDAHYIPDSETNDRIFQKNKKHLALLSFIVLQTFVKSDFSEPLLFASVLRTSICFSALFSFLCFCRTRIWVYYLTITIILSAFPYFVCFYANDLSFEVMGLAFAGPSTLLLITDRKCYLLIVAFSHLLAMNTILKSVFIRTFETLNTEVFVSKFIAAASGQMVLTIFANILIQVELTSAIKTLYLANKTIKSALTNYKDFLENFSQEIRNPIQSLIGNLELTLLQPLTPPSATFVETARICAEVLLQKINNILDTGEIETDRLRLVPRSVQIYDVITKVWSTSSELIKKKDLAGLIKIHKDIPATLVLDQARIKQILFNLLNNAIKFTNRGAIYLTIKWLDCIEVDEKCFDPQPYENLDEGLFEKEESFSLLETSERHYNDTYLILSHIQSNFAAGKLEQMTKKGVLKIVLRDSGCGMSPETFEKAFSKFPQVYAYGSKREIGTGLGLFVTKQLATKMKGDVKAYTKVNVGTTLIVCIPCEGVVA